MYRMTITDMSHVDVSVARISKKEKGFGKECRGKFKHISIKVITSYFSNFRNDYTNGLKTSDYLGCVNSITFIIMFQFYILVFNRQQRYVTFTSHAVNWDNKGYDEIHDQERKYGL